MKNKNNIMYYAKELMQLYEEMYQQLKLTVDYIISNKITNQNTIGRCLDFILDIPTEKGRLLFYELCNYYLTINEENAKEYFFIYEDTYGKEEDKSLKKTK